MLSIKQSAAIRDIYELAQAGEFEKACSIFIESVLYNDAMAADEKRGYDSRDAIIKQNAAKEKKFEKLARERENNKAFTIVREYVENNPIEEWTNARDIMMLAGVNPTGKAGQTAVVIKMLCDINYLEGEKMGSRKKYRSIK